ncbi:MAG: PDZ domain-containing protein [Clostridia bacterium]|nr:PDZ domain-containing protein [Clostridia bacterium]
MKKRFSILTVIVSVLVAVILTFNVTFVVMNVQHNKEINGLLAKNDYLSTLMTVEQVIKENYLGDVDDEELKHAVIRGYLSGIGDKYSQYMTASEYDEYLEEFRGNAVGIGVNVLYENLTKTMEVIEVYANSPAEKSGILVGDFIVGVDGTRVSEADYYDVLDLIKGEKGTSVTITVSRAGVESDLVCVRDDVEVKTVKYRVYSKDPTIGIIRISSFAADTPKDFKAAVEELKTNGCTKFIFDVRNNGGGELNSIVTTLDYLLPSGKLAYIRYASGKETSYDSNAAFLDASVAVLVNENTASAAELFAAALRDYAKEGKYDATLVGDQSTYGKGVFQSMFLLPDGSAFKFTTGRYDPPCGVNYDGVGVIPDNIVELSEEAQKIGYYKLTDDTDNQLAVAAQVLASK